MVSVVKRMSSVTGVDANGQPTEAYVDFRYDDVSMLVDRATWANPCSAPVLAIVTDSAGNALVNELMQPFTAVKSRNISGGNRFNIEAGTYNVNLSG